MKHLYVIIHILATYTGSLFAGSSTEINKCFIGNDTKFYEHEKYLTAISSLVGHIFETEKDGYNYVVSICSDISKQHDFASVTRNKSKEVVVLGRRNDTRMIRGDSWLMLSYGSGDAKDQKLHNHRRATVYLVCSQHGDSDQNHIQLVEEDGLNYQFVLPTLNVCNLKEEKSSFKVFFIILTVFVSGYFLIGITYKRYVQNARGCQQIPCINFWSKVGNTLSDGCNYICRCDVEPEDSWNNITSNFDSVDRDDALLRP